MPEMRDDDQNKSKRKGFSFPIKSEKIDKLKASTKNLFAKFKKRNKASDLGMIGGDDDDDDFEGGMGLLG